MVRMEQKSELSADTQPQPEDFQGTMTVGMLRPASLRRMLSVTQEQLTVTGSRCYQSRIAGKLSNVNSASKGHPGPYS